jgi:hypothetical protein
MLPLLEKWSGFLENFKKMRVQGFKDSRVQGVEKISLDSYNPGPLQPKN